MKESQEGVVMSKSYSYVGFAWDIEIEGFASVLGQLAAALLVGCFWRSSTTWMLHACFDSELVRQRIWRGYEIPSSCFRRALDRSSVYIHTYRREYRRKKKRGGQEIRFAPFIEESQYLHDT